MGPSEVVGALLGLAVTGVLMASPLGLAWTAASMTLWVTLAWLVLLPVTLPVWLVWTGVKALRRA